MCGTPEFMAPEFVLSTGYCKCVDWWALGCILVEMYCGRSPFEFDGDLKMTFKKVCLIGMGRETFTPPKELCRTGSENANDFSRRLLAKATERIGRRNSRSVEEHSYFSGIDFGLLRKKLLKAPYVPKISHAADMSHFDVDEEEDDTMLESDDAEERSVYIEF
jgi:serine/threonine protein kinase